MRGRPSLSRCGRTACSVPTSATGTSGLPVSRASRAAPRRNGRRRTGLHVPWAKMPRMLPVFEQALGAAERVEVTAPPVDGKGGEALHDRPGGGAPPELGFRHEADDARGREAEHERVDHRLVVGDEDARPLGGDALAPGDLHAVDGPCRGPVAADVEKAVDDHERARSVWSSSALVTGRWQAKRSQTYAAGLPSSSVLPGQQRHGVGRLRGEGEDGVRLVPLERRPPELFRFPDDGDLERRREVKVERTEEV